MARLCIAGLIFLLACSDSSFKKKVEPDGDSYAVWFSTDSGGTWLDTYYRTNEFDQAVRFAKFYLYSEGRAISFRESMISAKSRRWQSQ